MDLDQDDAISPCAGGVKLLTPDYKICVDNTLNGRMDVVLAQKVSACPIVSVLFGVVASLRNRYATVCATPLLDIDRASEAWPHPQPWGCADTSLVGAVYFGAPGQHAALLDVPPEGRVSGARAQRWGRFRRAVAQFTGGRVCDGREWWQMPDIKIMLFGRSATRTHIDTDM